MHKDDKNRHSEYKVVIRERLLRESTIKSSKIDHLGPDNSSGRRLGVESGIALTSAMIQSLF